MKTGLIFQDANGSPASNHDDVHGPLAQEPISVVDGAGALPILGRMPGAVRAAGIALCAPCDEDLAQEEPRFELWVVDEDGHPAQRLGRFAESDVVAEWRRIAAASGLVLMVMDGEGTLTTAQPQIGRLRLGAVRIRRGHGLLAGRRPRFLVRRKTARLGARPQVHRNERVIAGGGEA